MFVKKKKATSRTYSMFKNKKLKNKGKIKI